MEGPQRESRRASARAGPAAAAIGSAHRRPPPAHVRRSPHASSSENAAPSTSAAKPPSRLRLSGSGRYPGSGLEVRIDPLTRTPELDEDRVDAGLAERRRQPGLHGLGLAVRQHDQEPLARLRREVALLPDGGEPVEVGGERPVAQPAADARSRSSEFKRRAERQRRRSSGRGAGERDRSATTTPARTFGKAARTSLAIRRRAIEAGSARPLPRPRTSSASYRTRRGSPRRRAPAVPAPGRSRAATPRSP